MYPEKHRGALRAPQLRAARARCGLARPPRTARRDQRGGGAACGQVLTACLSLAPALNRGAFDASMVMGSPVAGLTPRRAARSATENFPKPVMLTSDPEASASSMASRVASSTRPASAPDTPARSATCPASSDLFTVSSLPRRTFHNASFRSARTDRLEALRRRAGPCGAERPGDGL